MDYTFIPKSLSDDEKSKLEQQNSRLVPDYKANDLEKNAKKYWDLFYKRNEERFFKDRHWTTREFKELLNEKDDEEKRVIFEVGCGVGNFIFPLVEENLFSYIYACDLSPRAVEFVKKNQLYNVNTMKIFQCDITTDDVHQEIGKNEIDIVTLIFVLSAIHPDKFISTIRNIFELLKPGGVLLFRDYGLYDMAQIRFKAGHKIANNFYMRQDGTRSFYFAPEYIEDIFTNVGFQIISNCYVHRRTINIKENIDVPRIFIQSKVMKPR
ncbi:tRNA N(3)-methylcytidine methyltransferase METTL6 [Harmonia axyridis]|uniref:tRNA N(3)-methylcytidine methyltransferase METTL6 n=1 Tax=Harmonia axyridis TaxID=115357 RepID=UPI001E277791|nr:tRNA N(3)-methylcytidine methyltransferase METTL6 [Harmonia axyridis]